jgi:hypothetical protein
MRHFIRFSLVRTAIATAAAASLVACGGSFSQTVPDGASGGGGGAPGQGGSAGATPDGGPLAPDATVLIDGNDSRCPATAPAPYSMCTSEQFICDYVDGQGCPRRFMCITQGSVVVGVGTTVTGVGGAYPGTTMVVWIAQSPMVGDTCGTPGKICSYPDSYPGRLVCTEEHRWEATSSTTTEGMTTNSVSVATTTNGSTSFTAGGQGGASDTGAGGSGGAGAADPN